MTWVNRESFFNLKVSYLAYFFPRSIDSNTPYYLDLHKKKEYLLYKSMLAILTQTTIPDYWFAF